MIRYAAVDSSSNGASTISKNSHYFKNHMDRDSKNYKKRKDMERYNKNYMKHRDRYRSSNGAFTISKDLQNFKERRDRDRDSKIIRSTGTWTGTIQIIKSTGTGIVQFIRSTLNLIKSYLNTMIVDQVRCSEQFFKWSLHNFE